ncbi:hypothetical protein NQ095_06610 [Rossellomorea sp. SC111]|uniref:hypothetical protein n=1 Tax=Rossellomorea sp. SC111 TaxID=2968985 RepID=UPI00215AB672|nr:hypothetical protein [Rossellomorea sp. SC111]MCR8848073.1 hypothetical protein [Rossellomorea sp. SC111]
MTKVRIFLFLTIAIFLSACNGKEMNLTDGDKQVTQQIDDVIPQYIVQKNTTSYYGTEKQFEVHEIYGTSEKMKAWLEKQES